MFCLRLGSIYGMCGSTGTTRSAYGGFDGLKWGLLEPRGGFQSVVKRQSAEQLHCTVIEITLIPPPDQVRFRVLRTTDFQNYQPCH